MGILIELNNPSRTYTSGQVVEGRVLLGNTKRDNVKEVTILLEGKSYVHWQVMDIYRDVETQKRKLKLGECSALQTLLSFKLSLNGGNVIRSAEGATILPFSFRLPESLPSSFSSPVGRVYYSIQVEMEKFSYIFRPKSRTLLGFWVNGSLDLNSDPNAPLPQECQVSKGSNFLVGRKGQLGFVLSIPNRCGFLPGEVLPFRVEIRNGSNRRTTGVTASLQQVFRYCADERYKTVKKLLGRLQAPGLEEETRYEIWQGELQVPEGVLPTKLGGNCSLIDLQYFLHFQMKISGLSKALTGILPVVIGTVPLRGQPGIGFELLSCGVEPEPSTSSNGSSPLSWAPNDSGQAPPPSYSELAVAEGLSSEKS